MFLPISQAAIQCALDFFSWVLSLSDFWLTLTVGDAVKYEQG